MMLIMMTFVINSCGVFRGNSAARLSVLDQAEMDIRAGELYKSKKKLTEYLVQDPANLRAQSLMARIIESEIEQQRELFENKSMEEFTPSEKDIQITTWLERSRTYLRLKQYDQAVFAAEKVFLYDPVNAEASSLIDEIRDKAIRDGKKESVVTSERINQELLGRVSMYRNQTEEAVEKGQWGAAELAAEKLLLIDPDNQTGLAVLKQIQARKAK